MPAACCHNAAKRPRREDHSMDIVCTTLDCADPERVAAFWNTALGWGGVSVAPDGSGALCGPAGGGAYLEFVRVPEPKAGKNRLHLGCSAGSLADLDREIARLAGLGASIAWEETFPPDVGARYRNVVLRDVEGNEFCLSGGAL
jgi:predicted enzyme related to lactoylglutathione lyase